MKANSDKSKQSNKATRRVLAGVLCGASVLSLVLSLVMPPISQAIANDAEAGAAEKTVAAADSSTESTDVDNTTGGDAENQKSDETEGGETGDDAQLEGQSEEEQQNEGTTTSDDKTVVAAAENEQTGAAAEGIDKASELKTKLESVAENQSGSFQLMKDLDCNEEIILNKSGSNITLDLNGFKIKYSSNNNKSLFNVSNSAEFTIMDSHPGEDNIAGSQPLQDQDHNLIADNCGKTAKMIYEKDVPTELTYYVTKSSVDNKDSTRTNETTYEHKVTIKGAIVACSSSKVNLIKLNGGTFNLQGGVLTQKNNCNVDGLIYAQNGSTVNMSGGYVCGASMGSDGAGAGIHVEGSTLDEGSTLEISGGVIAGNYAPSGGGVYARNSTVNMVDGIISGNGTNNNQFGYGAGICAENSNVTITNGYITNNRYQHYIDEENNTKHLGNGCHGGGGIAAWNGGSLTIVGGYITGNYSAEAGGGVYAGAWNKPLFGFTFSGGIIASNVAQNSEGGGIRIAAPTVGAFNVSGKKAYITNNTTNTAYDWGGGGVFVQGSSDHGIKSASLNIYNALITNNHANGFGGGFAACPTGKTAITDTNGIAVFGNYDGNSDGGYNRSGGGHDKNDDWDWHPNNEGGEITEDFKNAGHQDLFLIRDSTNNPESLPYIAAVTGQMLGGGAANWKGTIDGQPPTTIGKYEGAQAKYMIGLKSDPTKEDKDAATAAASLFITGNSSNIHGGGIMTNGDVLAGSTTQVSVYPKMKLKGTKELIGRPLVKNEFEFELLKQGADAKAPYFADDGTLQLNGCPVVGRATNDADGSFTFDLGQAYANANLVYYLVEKPGKPVSDPDVEKPERDPDIAYSKAIYKIVPMVEAEDSYKILDEITYTNYKITSVAVTKTVGNVTSNATVDLNTISTNDGLTTSIVFKGDKTFTNYTSNGSWTPKATKVVEGGEMKEFTLEFADNPNFTGAQTVKTAAERNKSQTLEFSKIGYKLSSLKQNDAEAPCRGASKTFTYYVREKTDGALFSNYKYDKSVYKLDVTMTDQKNGEITATNVTYTQIKDAKGEPIDKANPVGYNDGSDDTKPVSIPTFTNTYSTSLPLSGMSGVTLTYLAGAAVLCAAAAWMHIRRKANAKGGKRRE